MLKLLGALTVLSSFICIGVKKNYELNKRISNITEFRNMCEELRTEICLRNTPIPKAIGAIGKKYSNSIFINWSDLMGQTGVEQAFETAFGRCWDLNCFNKKDFEVLKSVSVGLGRIDLENQLRRLDYSIEQISSYLSDVKAEYANKCRLYLNGSILAGISLVIILI